MSRMLLVVLAALAAGCSTHPIAPVAPIASATDTAPQLRIDTRVAGHSVEGRPIEVMTLGEGPIVVMILATIHGNEPAGTPLSHQLVAWLKANPDALRGRRLVLIPVANPDGYAAARRTNARGVDLNRNFAAPNFDASRGHGERPLSEPEARVLTALVEEHRPDRVISIHQPIGCVDWDGPGERLARAMAGTTDLPARRIGSRPGSMGSWVGETLHIPIITVELRGADTHRTPDELWSRYGKMMRVAVTWPEIEQ